ncbi:MAG: hypothetical protein FJ285_09065 [Planctomycetes bacterium]|nr:hypothetical protein [Planctomycetota bacterium]
MKETDISSWHATWQGGPTIRATGWAARLPSEVSPPTTEDGICADLDTTAAAAERFGWSTRMPDGSSTIAADVLETVQGLMVRADEAGARIRVEIDPRASDYAAGPIGIIVFGVLRRAIEACAWVTSHGSGRKLDADRCNITLVVRLDGSVLRIHSLDEAGCREVPAADAAFGLAAATVHSLGGTLFIGSVPFGEETLVSAEVPLGRSATSAGNAA